MGIINESVLFCSRELERELAASNAEVERLKEKGFDLVEEKLKLKSQLTKAEAEVESLTKALAFIANDNARYDSTSYYRSVAHAAINPTNK